jgi:plastocyanin
MRPKSASQGRILTSTAAVVLAVGVAACGSSSHSSGGGAPASTKTSASTPSAMSTPSSAPAAGNVVAISAQSSGQLMFTLQSLAAKAGKVTIVFTNHAPEQHNFTIQEGTGATGTIVGHTPTFTGGSRTLVLHLKAGTYTYYCSVPGHRTGGMHGVLTVT